MLNHICPFFGYRVPCIYELKKGICRALHLETIREVFDIQREKYNDKKEAIPEETVENLIRIREGKDVTAERMMIYKGLLRNYPAKPKAEDVTRAKRIKEEQEFQEMAKKLREEEEDGEEDDTF